MANRYWVGGTGSWNTTNTVNWSDTSGGAGGFSVPTSVDDVFLDANSGTGTVTIATANMTVKSLNCTGYTGVLAGSTNISIAGSVTWGAGMTLGYSGALTITGTGTYTSNGKSRLGSLTINGSGITVTLGDAYTSTGASATIAVTLGTFNTAGYAVTALNITTSSSGARAITLGASAVTLTGNGFTVPTGYANFTLNAGTSTITLSSASAKTLGTNSTVTSLTFYNVIATGAGALTLSGPCTYNTLTIGNTVGESIVSLIANNNNTIATLNLNGSSPTARVQFVSSVLQTQRTITLTSFGTSVNCDFSDIAITGAAAGTAITRAGNIGGNSGITFPAPKTVYWNLGGSSRFTENGWAASSGGVPDVNNFPLAQDTGVVDNNSSGTGWTMRAFVYTFGTFNMSSRTTAFNVNFSAANVQFTGSFLCGTGNTFTTNTTSAIVFVGSGSSTIQSSGRSINHDIIISCRTGGSVTLADALTLNDVGCNLFVDSGSIDSAGYAVTVGTLDTSRTSLTKAITLGTSSVTIIGSGSNTLNLTNSGLSFSAASSTITFTNGAALQLSGNNNTFGTVVIAGGAATGNFTITGSNTFGTLSSTRTASYTLGLIAGTTQTFTTFAVSGSAGNLVTLKSTTTSQATIARPTAWTVGANSVDGGNNTGLSFTGSNPDYLSISYIRGVSSAAVYNSTVLESVTATDTILPANFLNTAFADSVSAADIVVGVIPLVASVDESASVFDSAASLLVYSAQIADTVTAQDAAEALVSLRSAFLDTATATDTNFGGKLYARSIAETSTATDTQIGRMRFVVSIDETAAPTDTFVARQRFATVVLDTMSAADTVETVARFRGVIADTSTATDAIIRQKTAWGAVAETSTVTDTAAAKAGFAPVVLDTATATDALSSLGVLVSFVDETPTATDTVPQPTGAFNASFVDFATAQDAIIGAFLWNVINDNQTPDWQNVNTSVNGGWTTPDTDADPGWTNIST